MRGVGEVAWHVPVSMLSRACGLGLAWGVVAESGLRGDAEVLGDAVCECCVWAQM